MVTITVCVCVCVLGEGPPKGYVLCRDFRAWVCRRASQKGWAARSPGIEGLGIKV